MRHSVFMNTGLHNNRLTSPRTRPAWKCAASRKWDGWTEQHHYQKPTSCDLWRLACARQWWKFRRLRTRKKEQLIGFSRNAFTEIISSSVTQIVGTFSIKCFPWDYFIISSPDLRSFLPYTFVFSWNIPPTKILSARFLLPPLKRRLYRCARLDVKIRVQNISYGTKVHWHIGRTTIAKICDSPQLL